MKIITLTNNKGGVTKTTATINLSYALALEGKRVGVIDFDPQKNLSHNIAFTGGSDLATVFKSKTMKLEDFGTTSNPNLFVLPNKGDVIIDLFFQFDSSDRDFILLDCIDELPSDTFDYLIIDTPPNLELQTQNALYISHYALMPVTLETNSVLGVQNTLNRIKKIQVRKNKDLQVLGAFVTKYDMREKRNNKLMTQELIQVLGDENLLLKSKIRTNKKFSNSQMYLKSIFESKNRKGSLDYQELAIEIIQKTN